MKPESFSGGSTGEGGSPVRHSLTHTHTHTQEVGGHLEDLQPPHRSCNCLLSCCLLPCCGKQMQNETNKSLIRLFSQNEYFRALMSWRCAQQPPWCSHILFHLLPPHSFGVGALLGRWHATRCQDRLGGFGKQIEFGAFEFFYFNACESENTPPFTVLHTISDL